MTDQARLDSIAAALLRTDDKVYLKMDVQGYELSVLSDARQTIERITAIEAELSLVPVCEGQALLPEVMGRLGQARFEPIWLEKVLVDSHTGHLIAGRWTLPPPVIRRRRVPAAVKEPVEPNWGAERGECLAYHR